MVVAITYSSQGLRILIGLLVVRYYGLSSRGILLVTATVADLLIVGASAGTTDALARWVSEEWILKRTLRHLRKRLLVFSVFGGLGGGVATLALLPSASLGVRLIAIAIWALAPLVGGLRSARGKLAIATGDVCGFALAQVGRSMGLLMVLLLALVLSLPFGLVLVGILIGDLPSALKVAAMRSEPGAIPRKARRFARTVLVTVMVSLVVVRLDVLLVAGLLPSAEVGLLGIATTWLFSVAPIGGALGQANYRRLRLADQVGDGRADGINNEVLVVRAIMLMVGAATPIILAMPYAIPLLYGHAADGAILPSQVMVAAAVPLGTSLALQQLLNAIGNPAASMKGQIVAIIFMVIAMPFMVLALRIVGAALTVLCAQTLRAVVMSSGYRRRLSEVRNGSTLDVTSQGTAGQRGVKWRPLIRRPGR